MAVVIPMVRSQCKVLNLWNGSSNNGLPVGWDQVGFDDSAWPDASSFSPFQTSGGFPAAPGGEEFHRYQNGSSLATNGFHAPIDNGAEAVAPWAVPPNQNALLVIRWRFTGTALPTDTVVHMYRDIGGLGFGANSGLFAVNGHSQPILFNPNNWITPVSQVTAGANLLAIAPTCNWATPVTAGWFALALKSATAVLSSTGSIQAMILG